MRYLFLTFLSIVLFLFVKANDEGVLGEKLYYATDREVYNPGDTISLCGILSDEYVFGSSHYSNYVNIELIDEADSVLSRHKVAVKDGIFRCVVPLDLMLHKGVYYLRGYTELMRSFRPEVFPIKPVFIGEIPQLHTSSRSPTSVKFYPESGNWVVGYLQGMAFSVRDKNGFPLETTACLMEGGDTIVSEIRTNSDGLGVFYLTPEQNVRYSLCFYNETEPVSSLFQIPETGKDPSFRVAMNGRKLNYFTHFANKNDNATYRFLIWYRGECLTENLVSTASPDGGFILPENLDGIISCILVRGQNEVMGERLLYLQALSSGNMLFKQPLQEVYKVGDLIRLNVAELSEMPVILRILPFRQETPGYLQTSLPSSFLLTSDLSSAVYNPNRYFKDDNSAKDLNLLLQTLQWGRYYWQDALADTFKYGYPPEEVLSLKGSILLSDNKPLKEGLLVCFNNETGMTYDCDIQSDGTFVIGVDDYEDGSSFFIQSYDERNKSDGLIIEFEEEIYPKVINPLKKRFPIRDLWTEFDENQPFSLYGEGQIEWVIQMSEITVKSKKRTKVIPAEEFYYGKSVTPKNLERYNDIRHALASIPFIKIIEYDGDGATLGEPYIARINRGVSLLGGESSLTVLLDGQVVSTNQVLNLVNVRDVESISLLSPAQALALTPFALDGALSVKTKDYKYEFKSMGINYQPVGLSSTDGFNDKIINVTTNGEIMSLTAPQEAGEYQLILEGIDDGGRPFYHTYPFTVKK